MQGYTPEQRQGYADMICQMVREWVVEKESDFHLDLERGVEWCSNRATGDRTPRANKTFTLTLQINGGASASEGPSIVSAPTMYRGPEP